MTNEITKVLLIEDDPLAAEIANAFIGRESGKGSGQFHFEWRNRLEDGLARLAQGGIDLVLLDFCLPDSEGLETFVRLHERFPNIATIPLTGTGDEEMALKAIQLGAQDYIFKGSVNPQVLLRAIRYAVERKRNQEALRRAHDELEQRVKERTAALSSANDQLVAQVAERLRAEEELRLLSHRLVEVQEAERRNIARELHDEIGQILTGLKLALEMASRQAPDGMRESLAQPQTMVNDLMGHVRALSLDLRPAMLDDLGLLHALLWHFERYSSQTGIRVLFQHAGIEAGRFSPGIETAAYRIVQEALTNVARYATVNEVKVNIFTDAEHLSVLVEDHGAGFVPSDALASASTGGLAGMRERAQLLGGSLTIEAAPDEGTRISALLPVGD
jgi:signal transduction histidine kinase